MRVKKIAYIGHLRQKVSSLHADQLHIFRHGPFRFQREDNYIDFFSRADKYDTTRDKLPRYDIRAHDSRLATSNAFRL